MIHEITVNLVFKPKCRGEAYYFRFADDFLAWTQFTRLLYKWLNRQSQKRSYNWERFNDALAWVGWPSLRIIHQLEPYRRMSALNGS